MQVTIKLQCRERATEAWGTIAERRSLRGEAVDAARRELEQAITGWAACGYFRDAQFRVIEETR